MKRRSFLVALAGLALPALDTGFSSREQQIQYCRSRMYEQIPMGHSLQWIPGTGLLFCDQWHYTPRWVVMREVVEE